MARAAAMASRSHSAKRNSPAVTSDDPRRLRVIRIDLNSRTATFKAGAPDDPAVPDIIVPLNTVRPQSEEDTGAFWNALVKQLMGDLERENRIPKFVKHFSTFVGDDSSGEPAVYVKIFVDAPKGAAGDARVSRWNAFANLVQDAMVQLRLQRLPYVLIGAN
jgi:hypothetical protein